MNPLRPRRALLRQLRLGLSLGLLLATASAHAQPEPPPALDEPAATAPAPAPAPPSPIDRRMADALRAYQAGEYGAAIASFRAAFAIEARPEILFAIAQAERKGGDCRAAVVDYTRFLSGAPPERQAAAARDQRDRCEADLRTSPGTTIEVPSLDDAPAPAPAASIIAPPPAPAPRPAPIAVRAGAPWWHDPIADGLVVGTGALLGLGAGYSLAGGTAATAANSATTYDRHAALAERAHRDRVIAVASWGAAAAVGAVAVWRIVRHHPEAESIALVPSAGAGDVGVALLGSF